MTLVANFVDADTFLFRNNGCLDRGRDRQADGTADLTDRGDERTSQRRIFWWECLGYEKCQDREDGICATYAKHHSRESIRPVSCVDRYRYSEEQRRHANAQRAKGEYVVSAYRRQDVASNQCNKDARYSIWQEAKSCLNHRQALEVLEPVRREDEIVVERREEQCHEHVRPRELPVLEDRHLHQGSPLSLIFEIVLPETETEDDEYGHYDEGWHPCCIPTYDVSFRQRKKQDDEANGDQSTTYPVDTVSHAWLRLRRWDGNDKVAGDCAKG